jgi:imidazole glycerol-phosphate synthase subunit HisH
MGAAPAPAGGARIAVLEVGMGNLRSIEKALEHVGARPERTEDAELVRACDGIVLPGVGAFPRAMEEIRDRGYDVLLEERLEAGVPLLGICLGMQLLFERSEELGGGEGLGVLRGEVRALAAPGLKIPQIGWNAVTWRRPSELTAGLPQPCAFYHVHSLAAVPAEPGHVVGTATYGGEFASVVASGNVFGVQFHPEKSGPDGLALLAAFAGLCRSSGDAPSGRALSGAAGP